MKFIGAILGAGLFALTAIPAHAADWNVDPAASSINFKYLKDGKPADGIFSEFSGSGRFNAEDPASARLTLKINTTSIDLYDTMASAFATSAEWFDSKNHPFVVYELTGLKALDGTAYEAQGTLEIRGETQPITTRIDLEIDADQANASGALNITRADYLLGIGPSAAFVEIGPEVAVTFDLKARPEN